MNSRKSLLLLVPFILTARFAQAENVDAKERAARMACLSGDYAKGVAILNELFVDFKDPSFIYNSGRCFEQNRRYDDAIARFQEYLRAGKKLSAADKADAQKHIVDCQDLLDKQASKQALAAPVPAVVPPPVEPAAPAPAVPASPPVASATSEAHPWQHSAKWIAAGAAVGLAAFGGVEYYRYSSKNHDFNNDPKCVAGGCESLASSADTAQTLAIVGFSAAGVAAGAAVIFWLTDSPRASAGLSFSCAPTLAGVACLGSF
jgi:tetratricopeptide (TPR) repeat protein